MSEPGPAIRLCNTINRHRLPAALPFDPSYHGCLTPVRDDYSNHLADRIVITKNINSVQLQESVIEPLLVAYANRLATCDDSDELASVHNTCQPLPRCASNVLRGYDAGRAWLMQHVFGEVNEFLAHWPIRCARALTMGLKEIGWRMCSPQETAEGPDFELYAILGDTTRRLGIFNYEPSMSVSDSALMNIADVARWGITIASRPGSVDVQSVGLADGLRKYDEQDPLVRAAAEWSREDTHIAILSNYIYTFLFLADTPQTREHGSEQNVRMSGEVSPVRLSHPGRMADSLVGFLLGVSLYAVERLGLDLLAPPALQQVPAQVPAVAPLFVPGHAVSPPDGEFLRVDQLGDQPISFLAKERDVFRPAKHVSGLPGVLYGPYMPSTATRTLPTLSLGNGDERVLLDPVTIELSAHRGRGVVWDVFSATTTGARGNTPLVVKLTDLSTFAGPELEGQLDIYTASRKVARRLICAELQAYAGPLQALQGTVVPRLLGVAGGVCAPENGGKEREIWAVLFEDAGKKLSKDFRRLPSIKRDVYKLYAQLHAAGVLHGDPQWDHFLAPPPRAEDDYRPALRLIDFGHSDLREDVLAAGGDWERACKEEMRLVEELFWD